MILKYPTGFYREQLAKFVSDTNVTYNISNNAPVRSNIVFQKVPDGISYTKIKQRKSKRSDLGNLIYTISNGSSIVMNSGQKNKNIGDYLEFSDLVDVAGAVKVAENISAISHDLNYLDYTKMGLSQDEVAIMQEELRSEFEMKTEIVNNLKASLADNNIVIQNNSKQINELNSTITALKLTNSTVVSSIIVRLENQVNTLIEENTQLQILSTELLDLITTRSNEMRALGALIK